MSGFRRTYEDGKHHGHAASRSLERFNMELTPEYYSQIRRDILDGVATLIEEQPNGNQKWEVLINGSIKTVIWKKFRNKIITMW